MIDTYEESTIVRTFGKDEEQNDDAIDIQGPHQLDTPNKDICFAECSSDDYCICIIDPIYSTEITAGMSNPIKIRSYYLIFLNAIATIVKHFDANVIENSGYAVIFYFPNTSNSYDALAFNDVLECCFATVSAPEFINAKLGLEELPEVNYGICAD